MRVLDKLLNRFGLKGFNPYITFPSRLIGNYTWATTNQQSLINSFKGTVYMCVSIRAEAIAKSQFYLYVTKANKDIEVKEHPFLSLMAKPNSFKQTFFQIMYTTQMYLDLLGNAYWYMPRDSFGIPTEILVLPSNSVRVVLDTNGLVSQYAIQTSAGEERINAEEVIHFKYPNPKDFYYGMSPLMAAADQADIEGLQSVYQKTFLLNDGVPRIAILSKIKMTDETFTDMKERWEYANAGVGNAGRPLVLEGGLDVKPISLSAKEMDYLESKKENRDEIMRIFKIPKAVANVIEDVNRSASKDSMSNFLDNCVEPLMEQHRQVLELFIQETYDERLKVKYWITRPSDMELQLKENVAGLRYGYLSVNEVRKRIGEDPVAGKDELVAMGGGGEIGGDTTGAVAT